MQLGTVEGSVWGGRVAPGLMGHRLLVVRLDDLDAAGRTAASDRTIVALDALGAGPGDRVVVVDSSRARDLTVGPRPAAKAVVLGIVDGLQEGGP